MSGISLSLNGHRSRHDAANQIGESADLSGLEFRNDQDGELVAGEPGQRIPRFQDAGQPPREGEQNGIGGGKPDGLVDLLEPVDVDADDGGADAIVGLRERQDRVDAIEEKLPVRQAGQIVVHGVVQKPFLGDLCLGDVREGADNTDHLAVGPDDGTCFHAEPVIIRAVGTQAEFLIDPPAPLLEHRIETGAETIPLGWMQDVEPGRGRPFERAAGKAQLHLDLGTDIDAVGRHVPVENDVAAAGQGESLAFGFR